MYYFLLYLPLEFICKISKLIHVSTISTYKHAKEGVINEKYPQKPEGNNQANDQDRMDLLSCQKIVSKPCGSDITILSTFNLAWSPVLVHRDNVRLTFA